MNAAHVHPSRRTGAYAAAALVALLLGSAASDPVWSSPADEAAPREAARAFAWSPDQVRELIAIIGEVRAHGLDPQDYGVAALRSELELAEQLWRTPGSAQLDTLARASALALAADLRGLNRSAAAGLARTLDPALASGRLRQWLLTSAPATAARNRTF